jgi:hypothetical protein
MLSALLHGLREAVRRYRDQCVTRMCVDAYYRNGWRWAQGERRWR